VLRFSGHFVREAMTMMNPDTDSGTDSDTDTDPDTDLDADY
jgi:hypothetical protein